MHPDVQIIALTVRRANRSGIRVSSHGHVSDADARSGAVPPLKSIRRSAKNLDYLSIVGVGECALNGLRIGCKRVGADLDKTAHPGSQVVQEASRA